jgi:tetratricopeptide (TPR) repeat protein
VSPFVGAGVLAVLVTVQAAPASQETPPGVIPPGAATRAAPESPRSAGAGASDPTSAAHVRPSPRVRPSASLEALWRRAVEAERSGDVEEEGALVGEIRHLRIERNIDNLETIALGLVARGAAHLDAGTREKAEGDFDRAVELAPGLPDGHYGRAAVRLKGGLLGVVPSLEAMTTGVLDFLPTAWGRLRSSVILVSVGLLSGFLALWAVALTLLLRHGGLLRHDLEEWLGPSQSRSASLALFLLAVLFPLAGFQGWGWLPLWWLAVLFPYFSRSEKIVSVAALVATVAVGPALKILDRWEATAQNPLYQAAVAAVEGQPTPREIAVLEAAASADPEDRDLAYLLGSAWRRSGRVDSAAALYRTLLARDPNDAVARNNLANLEFVHGQYDSALARHREGARAGGPPEVVATSLYNLSIAHLQKFEYQAFNEAKAAADRLAPRRVAAYDRWKYESGDYAVVDLVLSRDEVWRKFAGVRDGVGERNVSTGGGSGPPGLGPRALANRFTAGAGVLVLVALGVGLLRGRKAFTVHCSRCGTPFCRHCHLGTVVGDLCSQCHHLFVVRDGVSGPARNRKMLEVQERDARRARLFRILSVLSPGAGHLYARQTLLGVVFVATWYSVIAGLVTTRLMPLTEVSSRLTPPWWTVLVVLALVVIWVLANRLRPDLEAALPKARAARRGRTNPQGA